MHGRLQGTISTMCRSFDSALCCSSLGSKTVRVTKNAIAEIDRSRRGKRPLLSSPSHVSTTVSSSITEKEAGWLSV